VHKVAEVKSGVNKRCTDDASCIRVKNRTDATNITDVVETCPRGRTDVIREGKMRIKNETEVIQAEAVGGTE